MGANITWDSGVGKRLIAAAADLWSGSEVPDWREHEYARGQVELLRDVIDVTLPHEEGVDGEECKDRILQLMRGQEMVPRETLTEAQLTERFKDYQGDAMSAGTYNVVVEGWEDVTETPSQCIIRLNTEVMEVSRAQLSAEANAQQLQRSIAEDVRSYHAGHEHIGFSEDSTPDSWWIELQLGRGDTTPLTAGAELTLTDVEALDIAAGLIEKVYEGRVMFRQSPVGMEEG